jgi:hypothetical protein
MHCAELSEHVPARRQRRPNLGAHATAGSKVRHRGRCGRLRGQVPLAPIVRYFPDKTFGPHHARGHAEGDRSPVFERPESSFRRGRLEFADRLGVQFRLRFTDDAATQISEIASQRWFPSTKFPTASKTQSNSKHAHRVRFTPGLLVRFMKEIFPKPISPTAAASRPAARECVWWPVSPAVVARARFGPHLRSIRRRSANCA